MKTSSSRRNVPQVPKAGRLRGLRGFPRLILALAWAAFWFNTALFPCGEAVAAPFGGHSDGVSQSVCAAQPAHHSDDTHSGCGDHGPNSPCGYTLRAGPTSVGTYALLAPVNSFLEWFAIAGPAAPALLAASQAEYLAPREYHPALPFRLYLHTQRLLI